MADWLDEIVDDEPQVVRKPTPERPEKPEQRPMEKIFKLDEGMEIIDDVEMPKETHWQGALVKSGYEFGEAVGSMLEGLGRLRKYTPGHLIMKTIYGENKSKPYLENMGIDAKKYWEEHKKNSPLVQDWIEAVADDEETYFGEVLGSLGATGAGAAVRMATGPVGAALSYIMFQKIESEEIYKAALERGATEEAARQAAEVGGSISALLDFTGIEAIKHAYAPANGLVRWLISAGIGATVEGATEGFQQIINDLATEWAVMKDQGWTTHGFVQHIMGKRQEYLSRALEATKLGFGVGALLEAPGGVQVGIGTVRGDVTPDEAVIGMGTAYQTGSQITPEEEDRLAAVKAQALQEGAAEGPPPPEAAPTPPLKAKRPKEPAEIERPGRPKAPEFKIKPIEPTKKSVKIKEPKVPLKPKFEMVGKPKEKVEPKPVVPRPKIPGPKPLEKITAPLPTKPPKVKKPKPKMVEKREVEDSLALVGSRAEGTAKKGADWDIAVSGIVQVPLGDPHDTYVAGEGRVAKRAPDWPHVRKSHDWNKLRKAAIKKFGIPKDSKIDFFVTAYQPDLKLYAVTTKTGFVIGTGRSASEAVAAATGDEKPKPKMVEKPVSGGEKVVQTALKIDPQAKENVLVSIRELRAESGLSPEKFDAAIKDLGDQGKIWMHRHAHPAMAKPNEVVQIGEDKYMGIVLRPPAFGKAEAEAVAKPVEKPADITEITALKKGKVIAQRRFLVGPGRTEVLIKEKAKTRKAVVERTRTAASLIKQKRLREAGKLKLGERADEFAKAAGIEIPKFKSTEDAIKFGQNNKGDYDVIAILDAKYRATELEAQKLNEQKKWDEGIVKATEAQLYREAREVADGTAPEILLKPIGARAKFLQRRLENVGEKQKLAIRLHEDGIPYYHEFLETHRGPTAVARREYERLFGKPEQITIGKDTVAIGFKRAEALEGLYAYDQKLKPAPLEQADLDTVDTAELDRLVDQVNRDIERLFSKRDAAKIKLQVKRKVTHLVEQVDSDIGPAKGKLVEALGKTTINRLAAVVELSLAQDKTEFRHTTFHEAFHVLSRWVLSADENTRLLEHFNGNEEAAADAFGEFALKKLEAENAWADRPNWLRKLFEKIRSVLRATKAGLSKGGYKTPDDVFERIWGRKLEAQKVGEREAAITPVLSPEELDTIEIDTLLKLNRRIERSPEFKAANEKVFGKQKKAGLLANKSLEAATDHFVTKYLDRFNPILKQIGEVPYKLARMTSGSSSVMHAILYHGKAAWNKAGTVLTVNERKNGFLVWLKDWSDPELLLKFVMAQRANELDAVKPHQWREKMFDMDSRKAIIAKARAKFSNADLLKFQKELAAFNKSVLDIAEQAGLVDPAKRKVWDSEWYIPFFRLFEDAETKEEYFQTKYSPNQHIDAVIQTFMGADQKLGEPLENIVRNWSHIIHESMRNLARKEAVDQATSFNYKTADGKMPLIEKLESKDLYHHYTKPKKSWQRGRITYMWRKNNREVENVLSYFDGGKRQYVRINDAELFESMLDRGPDIYNDPVYKILRLPKHWLTYGATFSAGFRVRNLIRDTVHQTFVEKSVIPVYDAFKGFAKALREDQDMVDLLASGASFSGSYLHADDPQAMQKFNKQVLKSEGQGAFDAILWSPKKALDWWGKIGAASENAHRLLIQARNKDAAGNVTLEGAFKARDLIDFSMRGNDKIMATLISLTPFLNARIQGLYRLTRAAKHHPWEFAAKAGIMAAASIAYYAAVRDDDRYKRLQKWDRAAYYHFWIGDTHIRLPKPFEVGAIFSTMFENAAAVAFKDEKGKFFLEGFMDMMSDTFHILDWPQAFKPVIEQIAGKNLFTKRPIIPRQMEDLPASDQYRAGDQFTLRMMAPYLEKLPGWSGDVFGSPERMTHLIRAYTSSLGLTIMALADRLVYNFGNWPKKPDWKAPNDLWVIGDFVKMADVPPRNTRYQTEFYDFVNEVDKLFRKVNKKRENMQFKEARELQKKYTPELRARARIKSTKTMISDINKQMRLIEANPRMSSKRKRSRIDALRKRKNKLLKRAYEKVIK